ncbi:VPS10 domain-containing receptor SorCS3-like [Coregonus clupeaformis]|uniref:VPS10 domain-containing receptor SorCS3-like n=1 Tax=Coregonus clupeaformis TaxID=59861 RepID=UPI001BDFF741|nr:VPS10 domain-containing receptor SorCS3-like [Coregonus clupeaformis]
MLIANRRLDNQVKTYITYNKGHDWRLLQAPATDLAGNDIHCVLGILGLSGRTITLECSSHLMLVTTGNRISFDEGRQWTRHSFSLVPLFVDGMLVEAGTENQIMTFFGHFSHRSEWQLIKIDYKSIFNRKCTEGDYQTWHLHNK